MKIKHCNNANKYIELRIDGKIRFESLVSASCSVANCLERWNPTFRLLVSLTVRKRRSKRERERDCRDSDG
jgi:hypothetical protein